MKKCITDIPISGLRPAVEEIGLKRYAADQLVGWLYKRGAGSFEEMTNISADGRQALARVFDISQLEVQDELAAEDGTRKFLFRLYDDKGVEAVLIPSADGRTTLCISTQVGCALGCVFCRTARMGLVRNLTQGEILGQVLHARRVCRTPITNIVFMGMGEPMMNLDAVCGAIEILLSEKAFGFSKRRITLSTAGLIPQLGMLASRFDVKIAVSLNAVTDELRNRLMPVSKKYPLAELMAFCRDYTKNSKHRITFEYVLIGGLNDSGEDMRGLVNLLKGMRAKINLIPFNPFPGSGMKAPGEHAVRSWQEFLAGKGVQVNVRASKGQDILAACGQLTA